MTKDRFAKAKESAESLTRSYYFTIYERMYNDPDLILAMLQDTKDLFESKEYDLYSSMLGLLSGFESYRREYEIS